MKKQYKIQLPKGKKVTMTNVDFENGVMTVNVELKKDDSKIWDKIIQEYGEAICGKKAKKYEPKDGDFISFGTGLISIFKNTEKYWFNNYATLCGDCLTLFKEGWVGENIRPATEEEKKLLIDKLSEVGKRWNEEKKCLENVRWRANDGYHYYYLLFGDADLLVTETTDIRTYKDDERYNRGNYFKTRETAEKTATQIREILKNSKAE